jgi:hypothetical protein
MSKTNIDLKPNLSIKLRQQQERRVDKKRK